MGRRRTFPHLRFKIRQSTPWSGTNNLKFSIFSQSTLALSHLSANKGFLLKFFQYSKFSSLFKDLQYLYFWPCCSRFPFLVGHTPPCFLQDFFTISMLLSILPLKNVISADVYTTYMVSWYMQRLLAGYKRKLQS